MADKPLRVLVCGGRRFDDHLTLGSWLSKLNKQHGIAVIIHGGASSADLMAGMFAQLIGVPSEAYPADWSRGLKAGPERNARMLKEGKPDLVIAFEGGHGTANMVQQAERAGVEVIRATKVEVRQ